MQLAVLQYQNATNFNVHSYLDVYTANDAATEQE